MLYSPTMQAVLQALASPRRNILKRAVDALRAANRKSCIPALPIMDGQGHYWLDRARTRPANPATDLEKPIEYVDDLTGLPVGWTLGPELVANGGFDGGLTGWLALSGGWSWSGGAAVLSGDGSYQNLRQSGVFTVGKTYAISMQISGATGAVGIENAVGNFVTSGTGGTVSAVWKADHTVLSVKRVSGPTSATIDNISVREVIRDESWMGPEVSLDPEFDNPGVWSFSGSTPGWSVSGGLATVSATASSNRWISGLNRLTVGSVYKVRVVVQSVTSGFVTVDISAGTSTTMTAAGTYEFVLRATVTSLALMANSAFVGSVASLSAKEIPGHPVVAAVEGQGPLLTARANLLQWTEFDSGLNSNTASASGGLVSPASISGYRGAIAFGAGTTSYVYKAQLITPNTGYTISVDVKMDDGFPPVFGSNSNTSPDNDFVLLVGSSAAGHPPTSAVLKNLGGGVYRVRISGTSVASPTSSVGVIKYSSNSARTFKVTAFDLRLSIHATPAYRDYQRVSDGTTGVFDYDAVGFPVWLRNDGTRAMMTLGTVDMTATNKAVLLAMMLKESDSTASVAAECSANYTANDGAMAVFAPSSSATPSVVFGSRGTANVSSGDWTTLSAPRAMAVMGYGNIGGPFAQLTVDGAEKAAATGSQGAGNYGNHRLNSFGRDVGGAASLRFVGRMAAPPALIDMSVLDTHTAQAMLREYAASVGHTYG